MVADVKRGRQDTKKRRQAGSLTSRKSSVPSHSPLQTRMGKSPIETRRVEIARLLARLFGIWPPRFTSATISAFWRCQSKPPQARRDFLLAVSLIGFYGLALIWPSLELVFIASCLFLVLKRQHTFSLELAGLWLAFPSILLPTPEGVHQAITPG